MLRHAAATGAITLAFILFSIPLFIKYHVYKSQFIHIVPGDMVPVSDSISSVWCEGQRLQLASNSTFNAYLFNTEPVLKQGYFERSYSMQNIILPNRAQEYWGFHFLANSMINVSACSRLSGGLVILVKGSDQVLDCVTKHRQFWHSNNSKEDITSEEESSDEGTSSISSSQGVVSNETNDLFECRGALSHAPIPFNLTCRSRFPRRGRKILTHQVKESGYYYLLFSSYTYLDILPNNFSVKFVFDRTSYDLSPSSLNCTSVTSCDLPVSFSSHDVIVFESPAVNQDWGEQLLETSCLPRKGLFFLFYLGFALIIFICAFY